MAAKKEYHHECLDYIFIYKNQAYKEDSPKIKSYLDVPKKHPLLYTENFDDMQSILLPSEHWPSDHFSLVY